MSMATDKAEASAPTGTAATAATTATSDVSTANVPVKGKAARDMPLTDDEAAEKGGWLTVDKKSFCCFVCFQKRSRTITNTRGCVGSHLSKLHPKNKDQSAYQAFTKKEVDHFWECDVCGEKSDSQSNCDHHARLNHGYNGLTGEAPITRKPL